MEKPASQQVFFVTVKFYFDFSKTMHHYKIL